MPVNLAETVIDIVAQQVGDDPASITTETRFLEELGMDSLDAVEITIELEEEFDIDIDDAHTERIQTVGGLISYIEHVTAGKNPESWLADPANAPYLERLKVES